MRVSEEASSNWVVIVYPGALSSILRNNNDDLRGMIYGPYISFPYPSEISTFCVLSYLDIIIKVIDEKSKRKCLILP